MAYEELFADLLKAEREEDVTAALKIFGLEKSPIRTGSPMAGSKTTTGSSGRSRQMPGAPFLAFFARKPALSEVEGWGFWLITHNESRLVPSTRPKSARLGAPSAGLVHAKIVEGGPPAGPLWMA